MVVVISTSSAVLSVPMQTHVPQREENIQIHLQIDSHNQDAVI